MSMIDCFDYDLIGVSKNDILIYRLKQDIPSRVSDFDGKIGDILLGGGSGESSALRIEPIEAIKCYTGIFTSNEFFGPVVKAFWSPTDAYFFGCEYAKMGWDHKEEPIETWLTGHMVKFLLENYPDDYLQFAGEDKTELADYDGKIFRLPTTEEKKLYVPIGRK